jgi:hypothetical protein
MAHTPARLAVKIDRLSRAAHRFHRFAHHPLCNEYGGEVVRLGRRMRVCRGCLFVALGTVAGLLGSVAVPAGWTGTLALAVTGTLVLLGTMFFRSLRRKSRTKVVSRLLPALAMAYALGSALQMGITGWALAVVGTAGMVGVIALYRRRGPDRTPCASCPERSRTEPCRGIAPIVRRERAFRRIAGQWLARVGP